MKKKKIAWISISIFIVASLLAIFLRSNESLYDKQLQQSKSGRALSGVIDECASKIQSKYQTHHVGLGLGGEYSSISFVAEIYQDLDHDEARMIALDCWNLIKSEINSSDKLRPFLETYPFCPSLSLFISNADASRRCDPDVSVINVDEDGVCYHTNEPDKDFGYKNTFKESLEEAIDKNKRYLSHRADFEK